MRVAIVGSRSIEECGCPVAKTEAHYPAATGDPDPPGKTCIKMTVYFLILKSLAQIVKKPGFEGIVSGGAIGVDTLAENLARMSGIKVNVYRPESEKGKGFAARAMARNSRIVKNSDMVIAFFDPRHLKSAGTGDTVAKAIKAGKEVHTWNGKWER